MSFFRNKIFRHPSFMGFTGICSARDEIIPNAVENRRIRKTMLKHTNARCIKGQRPGDKPAQGQRAEGPELVEGGTSAALGLRSKKDKALKGRDSGQRWCRPFRALFVVATIPRALPWAGMGPGLWPLIQPHFDEVFAISRFSTWVSIRQERSGNDLEVKESGIYALNPSTCEIGSENGSRKDAEARRERGSFAPLRLCVTPKCTADHSRTSFLQRKLCSIFSRASASRAESSAIRTGIRLRRSETAVTTTGRRRRGSSTKYAIGTKFSHRFVCPSAFSWPILCLSFSGSPFKGERSDRSKPSTSPIEHSH